MGKQIIDLQELAKDQVSNDDVMMIRDVSENRDKRAKVGNIVGRPREGWISTLSDSWSFSSYSASTSHGIVNCNPGGLAIYSIGMRVKFVQGGVEKYAVVIGQTDTTLELFMLNDAILENAALASIEYSQSFAPQTDNGVNFFASLVTGNIDGLPVMLAVKNSESDPDVPAKPGYIILEAILGDEV